MKKVSELKNDNEIKETKDFSGIIISGDFEYGSGVSLRQPNMNYFRIRISDRKLGLSVFKTVIEGIKLYKKIRDLQIERASKNFKRFFKISLRAVKKCFLKVKNDSKDM